jgi:hypothetical protein
MLYEYRRDTVRHGQLDQLHELMTTHVILSSEQQARPRWATGAVVRTPRRPGLLHRRPHERHHPERRCRRGLRELRRLACRQGQPVAAALRGVGLYRAAPRPQRLRRPRRPHPPRALRGLPQGSRRHRPRRTSKGSPRPAHGSTPTSPWEQTRRGGYGAWACGDPARVVGDDADSPVPGALIARQVLQACRMRGRTNGAKTASQSVDVDRRRHKAERDGFPRRRVERLPGLAPAFPRACLDHGRRPSPRHDHRRRNRR